MWASGRVVLIFARGGEVGARSKQLGLHVAQAGLGHAVVD